MKIEYFNGFFNGKEKLLCVTHTERPTNLQQCDLNCLELRYSKWDRLPPRVDFHSLKPSSHYSPYSGSVTVWKFEEMDCSKPKLLSYITFYDEENFKPQFAVWYKKKLWVLSCERIHILSDKLSLIDTITHPWLSGAHTLVPDNRGFIYVSCSASDSVIIIDDTSLKIKKIVRMPSEIYGFNYDLREDQSVVDHYIHNDIQLTHINCAWPYKDGFLISTLIQGAIGFFDHKFNYSELISGFVGAHGIRCDKIIGNLYFCDSCAGMIVFLSDKKQIERRIKINSHWLHDAQQIEGSCFALSVSDKNKIEVMDIISRNSIVQIPCSEFGNGTQFLYYGG